MTLLMRAAQLQGLPVVTVEGGDDLAEVRDVIYDPEAGRLVGLTLNRRGFFSGRHHRVLASEKIHAIGKDAVMVLRPDCLNDPDEAPEEVGKPPVERNVIGNDVLTDGGVRLGTVRDLVLMVESTGDVVGYEIDRVDGGTSYLPLPAQLAVSGSALVVPALAEQYVRDDLTGLGAAVDEFRARISPQ